MNSFKKCILSVILICLISGIGYCDYPAKPSNPSGGYTAGSILTAAQLNLWFNALFDWANGGIKNSNISPDAAITFDKFTLPTIYSSTIAPASTTVTFSVAFTNGKADVYADGVLQLQTIDYTIASAVITFDEVLASGTRIYVRKLD